MFVSGGATILHADLDAFFASVEQRDDPQLRGKPVIVGGGVVLAASYEAKAFGIETAMGGKQARRLCPHAIVAKARFSAYDEASKAVYRVFDDMSPLVDSSVEQFMRVLQMDLLGPFLSITHTVPQMLDRLRAAGVPCAPINTYSSALADEQVRHMQWVQQITLPNGARTRTFGSPLRFSGKGFSVRRDPPALGQHNDEILTPSRGAAIAT